MRALALFLVVLAACSDGTRTVGERQLDLTSPLDGAQVFSRDPLLVSATADANRGVKSIALSVGDRVAKSCPFNPSSTDPSTCEVTVAPADFAAQVKNGGLRVTATLVDGAGESVTTSAEVIVSSLLVRFTQPAPAKPAKVSGTSTLAVEVEAEVPVSRVNVVSEDGALLAHWTTAPYGQDVEWPAAPGVGAHTLTATVDDAQGREATAKLDVDVACATDGDCEVHQRCCSEACAAACP